MKEQDFVREGLSEDELKRVDAGQEGAEGLELDDEKRPPKDEGDSRQRDEHGRFVKTEEQEKGEKAEKVEEPKTVDLRALQEARAEARELRDKYSRLEERTNLILGHLDGQKQAAEKAKEQPAEPPDPNVDIFAAIKYERERRMELEKQLSERSQAETQTRQQQEAEAAVWGYWEDSMRSVSATKPDFGEAAKFLSDVRVKQLQAYAAVDPAFNNPRQIAATIDNELKHIIVTAAQRNANPAEAVYALAQSFGYQPGQQQAAQGQQERQDGAATIREMAQRQERHQSLSSIQGGSAPAKLDAKGLAAMDDAAFQKLMATASGRAEIEAIMGVAN
jgi:hypothetical protein